MLRNKGLTEKLIVLGIDGMDPRFTRAMVDEGKMPNTKKLIEMGAARHDLVLLGGMPTITPPMWATLATGCYPMTHGITDYSVGIPGEPDMSWEAFFSPFCKAEQLWNVTAESGKKTLVFHWPGGAWPPSSDSENLYVVDGTSPGAMGNSTHRRDEEVIIIATSKTSTGGAIPMGAYDSHIDGEFSELVPAVAHYAAGNYKDPRINEYYEKYLAMGNVFQDYIPPKGNIKNGVYVDDSNMLYLADFPTSLSMSPIADADGWANAPEGAKEFTIYYNFGRELRPALILKNANGEYDKVAVYASKEAAEPLFVLDEDVYTPNCPDTIVYKKQDCNIVRNMRALEIAKDGSYVRMWAGNASDVDNSDCWYPRWIFDKIKANFGPPSASSMSSCQDEDLIIKCSGEQWAQCAQWQADAMIYMMENEGVEVVFSHFHGPDLSGHAYMKYLKNRETSKQDESVVREWHANTYRWTDDYIGRFLPYIDKGWTILLVSDHALICPEETPNYICDNSGVNAGIMKELGYTVLKKDENGKEIDEIDWEKTVAVQNRTNSIYINLKGRDRYGIVDPADKYELEEKIITDLYGYKDKRTGKRVVSVALHNKDAVLLGMGGPDAADIIILIHESFNFDHGESLSTAIGHNDTSVSPIFVAAGPGVKQGYEVKGWIREVDVAPTAAVLLGVNIPKDCEGAPAYQIFTERM
ncbi:MAG: alkaline phosphatase family protein [Peptococcaceae bacterium]|nr:alkaline phosphatase family protein [Peptococcaceae bacterium]